MAVNWGTRLAGGGGGGGGGGIALIQATDPTIEVIDGAGPISSVRTVFGPPTAFGSTVLGATHVTSTGPGAAPTYPTSHIFLSVGTVGSPISFDPGTYRGELSVFCSGTNNNSEYWFQVFANGVSGEVAFDPTLVPVNAPVGKAGATVTVTSILGGLVVMGAPMNFYFDIHVAFGGGTGSITYITAEHAWYRVA